MVNGSESALPAAAEELLDELWTKLVPRHRRSLSRRYIQSIAEQVSAAAYHAVLRPEDLIMAVKTSWSRHAAIQDSAEEHRVQWALTEVLSECIVEFYRLDGTQESDHRASPA